MSSSASSSSSPAPRRLRTSPLPCGAYTLSLGAVSAMASVAAVVLAFSTDNWTHVSVDRAAATREAAGRGLNLTEEALRRDHRYFDRVQVRKSSNFLLNQSPT